MKFRAFASAAFALAAGMAQAQGSAALPADVLVDPATPNKTIWHYPKDNAAVPEERPHRRDLSKWPTLSYDDKRAVPKPQRVTLSGPLQGDPQRGKEIAMNTQKGNCWACHALPGDAQPGTAGPSLMAFAQRKYSDERVYQQVFDARVQNPYTFMPPYGAFQTLSDQDIRDVVAFLQSIQ
jgi:sulfur oxidation c-type cytochrome SoxX